MIGIYVGGKETFELDKMDRIERVLDTLRM